MLSVRRPFEHEFQLCCFPKCGLWSGVGYCIFSSHIEFLRDGHCVCSFLFTLHKLSIVDPLHWLSFDWEKRKTYRVRAMAQGLISSWCDIYIYIQNPYEREVVIGTGKRISMTDACGFFNISVYLVQIFCIGNSFCWIVCWNFPRPG